MRVGNREFLDDSVRMQAYSIFLECRFRSLFRPTSPIHCQCRCQLCFGSPYFRSTCKIDLESAIDDYETCPTVCDFWIGCRVSRSS